VADQKRDYYEVLGVARDADAKAIKDAFRELALRYHPDRNKEPGAEDRFKEIAEAYAILSDPQKRADYDARGFAGVAGFSREDLFGGINFEDIFGGLNFGFGGGNPFEGFFHRRRSGPAHGANIEVEVNVPLARVASGGEVQVHLTRPATCLACHGTGEEGGAAPPRCEACQGSGRITRSRRDDKEHILIQHITPCPACEGRGFKLAHPCPSCQGRGEVVQDESLTLKIPVGVEDGMALRIPGKGMPSPDAGGAAGDLYAVVRTEPDPRFERVGADLLRQTSITVTEAVLGTTLTVPTLDGSACVTVPPGTQPDAVLRLKGKGLPVFGKGVHGDLFVRLAVSIPEHLSAAQRQLFEQLQALEKTVAADASGVHVGA
jgi:molecular chaperone DnaJ